MSNLLRSVLLDEAGATSIEYGLLASLIAAAIITTVMLLGTDLQALYGGIAAQVAAAF